MTGSTDKNLSTAGDSNQVPGETPLANSGGGLPVRTEVPDTNLQVLGARTEAFTGATQILGGLPKFNGHDLKTWLLKLQIHFKMSDIRAPLKKFHLAVLSLPDDMINRLPPSLLEEGSFEALQSYLSDNYEASTFEKYKMLKNLVYYNGKPSTYLFELRKLGSDLGLNDDYLMNVFIEGIPTPIARQISGMGLSLDSLARRADEIVKFDDPPYCSNINAQAGENFEVFKRKNMVENVQGGNRLALPWKSDSSPVNPAGISGPPPGFESVSREPLMPPTLSRNPNYFPFNTQSLPQYPHAAFASNIGSRNNNFADAPPLATSSYPFRYNNPDFGYFPYPPAGFQQQNSRHQYAAAIDSNPPSSKPPFENAKGGV